MKSILKLGFLTALVTLTTGIARAEVPTPTGDAGYDQAGLIYFSDAELTEVTVTMDPADLLTMLADPFNNTYRQCTVRIVNSQTDTTVLDVAIRPRGNTSRGATKKSWKLKFNEFVPGREVFGLEKLNLNGHQNDPSIIRGKLAWDVFNSFGVPSPRAGMVHLVINDGSLVDDVYINVEQIDDEFLAAWFGDDTGNLYQCRYKGERADLRYVAPGDASTYQNLGDPTYELENDSGADQFVDLADFISFIENTSDEDFAAQINDRFNVDTFLRAMAVDCVNGHWDDLWHGANNFYLYKNPENGVFEYIPFDLDNTYGIDFFSTDWSTRNPESFGDNGFGWDFSSPFGDGGEPPLLRRIFEIQAYQDQYFRYIRELVGAAGAPTEPTEFVFDDTDNDTFLSLSEPTFDIDHVTLSNTADDLRIAVDMLGPVAINNDTDDTRIMLFFDTRPGGSTSNPWNRDINSTTQSDYFIGSWTDGGGGFILYEWDNGNWNQRHASFDNPAGVDQDLSNSADSIVRYTIPLDRMNLSDTSNFFFDIVTTNDRDGLPDPGIDHLSNPSQSTPDYNTPSNPGPFVAHTLTPFVPTTTDAYDGLFTLAPREAHIDNLKALLTPHAFTTSFSGGNADYGYTNQTFQDSFTLPATYSGGSPWSWGIKPYIESRTSYLRLNTPAPSDLPRITINEVLAINESIIMDEAGQFEDFIELYNDEDVPVDLSGMYLSDTPGIPQLWRIPDGTIIGAKSYLLIWADDDELDGPLHANFKLGSSGELVTLSHRDDQGAVLINSLNYPALGVDESFGRYEDGSSSTEIFCAVTPAAPNDPDDACFTEPDPTPLIYINEWLASNDGSALDEFGDADDFIELYNAEDTDIDLSGRYLTDDLLDQNQWEFPAGTIIAAKSTLVVWADDEPEQGPLHATFKLGAGGESIGLYDRVSNQLAPIDTLTYTAQTTDVSEGRSPDGSPCFAFFDPSPNQSNPAGPADLNQDGVLDFFDISAFLTAFGNGDPIADFNNDAVFDFFDISAFLASYTSPCP